VRLDPDPSGPLKEIPMLAYKIVMTVMFGINIATLFLKVVQASTYKQSRVAVINGAGALVAITLLVWTLTL